MFLFLILLGFLPSIIWLSYYLRKDKHPEPKGMVLKIFLWGMLIAPVAAVVEAIAWGFLEGIGGGLEGTCFLIESIEREICASHIIKLLEIFIVVAFVEEYLKYFVVKRKALTNPEFDEPVDAMEYLIIAALGFAALENILILTSSHLNNLLSISFNLQLEPMAPMTLDMALNIVVLRFLGATLLHALASGIVGYFLALSLFRIERKTLYLISGFVFASLLHGLYNWFIMSIEDNSFLLLPLIAMLTGGAIMLGLFFKRIKKLASICK